MANFGMEWRKKLNDFSDDDDEDDSEDSKDNIIIRDINVSDEAKCLVNYSIINCIIFNWNNPNYPYV